VRVVDELERRGVATRSLSEQIDPRARQAAVRPGTTKVPAE